VRWPRLLRPDSGSTRSRVLQARAGPKQRTASHRQQGQGLGYAVRLMRAGLRHELVGEVDDGLVLIGRAGERGGGKDPVEAEGGVPKADPGPVELSAGQGLIIVGAVQAAAGGQKGGGEQPVSVGVGYILDRCAKGERSSQAIAPVLEAVTPVTVTSLLLLAAGMVLVLGVPAGFYVLVGPVLVAPGGVTSAWLLLTKITE
jgi:hypothetical protein